MFQKFGPLANLSRSKIKVQVIFGAAFFYVPALALQVTRHSCIRQKGRKDSDGRVQEVGLQIP